jgi:hypothetical protein
VRKRIEERKDFMKRQAGIRFFFLSISFLLFYQKTSFADEYHYVNSLVGERASGLGGAYTAVSDDPSGCYYNPAGIVFAQGRRLSISVNAYNVSTKTYKDALHKTTGEGEDWELKSSQLLPNFFGVIHQLGPGKIGFSYAVVDSYLRDQEQVFYNIQGNPNKGVSIIDRYVLNIDDEDKVYNLGPSYGIKLRDNLSTGITLYLHYRDGKIIRNHLLNLTKIDNSKDYRWDNYYLSWTEYGIRPVIGFMWEPFDKVSLGITFSRTFIFDSETRVQKSHSGFEAQKECADFTYGVCSEVFRSSEKRKFPYVTTAGIAYFPSPSLLLSADLSYYTDVSSYSFLAIRNVDLKAVLNGAMGIEYYLSPTIALRAGGFTDMANTEKLKSDLTDQPEHINIFGGTLSVTYFTKNSSLTLGGVYSYGSGKAQVITNSTAQQDATLSSLTIYIGAGYSY